MKVIGITGGIGMGKSTAADWFRRRSVPLTDSDLIARQVVEPGQPALTEIQRAFGKEMVGPDGRLRREVLAAHVFADGAARKQLEAILHPRIRAVWQDQIATWRAESRPVAVAIIPLLFETDAQASLDATICMACTFATQRLRLAARGWTAEQIDQRNHAQWPIERKIGLASFVVWTEGDLQVLGEQLERIMITLFS